jgi:gas vesicle protein
MFILTIMQEEGPEMASKYYKNVKALKSVDELLSAAERSLNTSKVIFTPSSTAPPTLKKSLIAVAGTGAVAAASACAFGATGAGVAGLAGAASFTGAGLAAGGLGTVGAIGAGAILAPVAIPAAILGGLGYLIFKNKKSKELREKTEYRLKKAVTLQNEIICKLKLYIQQLERMTADLLEENMKLRQKIDELTAVNEALMSEINKMMSDLSAA